MNREKLIRNFLVLILIIFPPILVGALIKSCIYASVKHEKAQQIELPIKLDFWDKNKPEVEILNYRCDYFSGTCEVILSTKQILVLDCRSDECWAK